MRDDMTFGGSLLNQIVMAKQIYIYVYVKVWSHHNIRSQWCKQGNPENPGVAGADSDEPSDSLPVIIGFHGYRDSGMSLYPVLE